MLKAVKTRLSWLEYAARTVILTAQSLSINYTTQTTNYIYKVDYYKVETCYNK